MNLDCPKAFAPFYRRQAAVTGVRIENGADRALSLGVLCSVLGGGPDEASRGATGPTSARTFHIRARIADWPDHLPPEIGDTWTVAGFPVLRAQFVTHADYTWHIEATAEGEVQR